VILVDANLLIYAIDSDSPHHPAAREWLEETLSGTVTVGLAWVVILAFVRLTTRGSVIRRPLQPQQALAYVDSWLDQPYVRAVVPGERHWAIFRGLVIGTGTAGNLTSDAHLAALALELGCPVYSADNDFRRFAGLEHVNPLEP
jgi:toxin-antitoxin system PIN domain toxin